jgi:hypothetical protein
MTCNRVHNQEINTCIDRVEANLNDRRLSEQYESGTFPGKPSAACGIREIAFMRLCRDG